MKYPGSWVYFLVFTFFNAVLSYSHFSYTVNSVILVFGILLPMAWAVRKSPPLPGHLPYSKEFLPPFPLWLLILLGLSALFIRFYRLETLFIWPTGDDGLLGMFAIGLSEKWNWKFFYTIGQVPPLPVCTAALLYKTGISPFLCLWLPSAVVSTLTIPAGYAAARTFFPKSFSLLCGILLAFGYWPFLMGRLCQPGIWLLLWTCGCLFFLGCFGQASSASMKKKVAVFLGFTAGLGSLTFTPWPVVVLGIALALFAGSFRKPLKNEEYILPFFVSLFIALVPFLTAAWKEGYSGHINAMSALSGWFSIGHQMVTAFSYLTELCWGTLEGDSSYVAEYGGMLNPLWGAAFLV